MNTTPKPVRTPRLLTIPEAAAQLQVSPRTLRRHIDSGDLPVVRIGRSIRITQEALNRFIQERMS